MLKMVLKFAILCAVCFVVYFVIGGMFPDLHKQIVSNYKIEWIQGMTFLTGIVTLGMLGK